LSGLFFAWKGIVFAKKRDNEMMRERHNFLTHCWKRRNPTMGRKLLPSWSDLCHLDVAFVSFHIQLMTADMKVNTEETKVKIILEARTLSSPTTRWLRGLHLYLLQYSISFLFPALRARKEIALLQH